MLKSALFSRKTTIWPRTTYPEKAGRYSKAKTMTTVILKVRFPVLFWKRFQWQVTFAKRVVTNTINLYMGLVRKIPGLIALLAVVFASCSKSDTTAPVTPPVVPPTAKLSYGDSVFYLQNQATDYIVSPVPLNVSGVYSGFPEGIEIDAVTGAVNVSKSEMGLHYRISFVATGSKDTINTVILLSGINFLDGFYKLTTADSILKPVYNGSLSNAVPGINNGTVFDEGSGCNNAGCNVNVAAGSINLAQTVRNGVFGATPANNDRHEFQLNYRINDKSGKALNSLKVKLYFFKSMADVTQEAYDIIASREGTVFRTASAGADVSTTRTFSANKAAKPRPPCIFVVLQ